MPVIELQDKDMVIEFPENMSLEEIERRIYTDIYKQPVISSAPEPSLFEKATGLLRGEKESTIGWPITEEDRAAFEPAEVKPFAEPRIEEPRQGLMPKLREIKPEKPEPRLIPPKKPYQEIKDKVLGDVRESLEAPEKEVSPFKKPMTWEGEREPHGVTGTFEEVEPKKSFREKYIEPLVRAETPEFLKKPLVELSPQKQKEIEKKLKPKHVKHFNYKYHFTPQGIVKKPSLPDFSHLDKTLGKAADAVVTAITDKIDWTPEEEMAFARKHPNVAAARYAIMKLFPEKLIPGMMWLTSPTDWEEFKKKSTEEQQDEILGETLGWVIAPGAFRGAGKLANVALRKIPGLKNILDKPIGKFLTESNWFRRLTNKERSLVVQSLDDMQRAGMKDADILRTLKKQDIKEFEKFVAEKGYRRGEAAKEPVTPKEEPIITEPPKPEAKVKEPTEKPTATFVYYWGEKGKEPKAYYRVTGGRRHKSDVTAATLEKEGIEIPETPEPPTVAPEKPTVSPRIEEKGKMEGEVAPKAKEPWEPKIVEDESVRFTAQYNPATNVIKINPTELRKLSGKKRYGVDAKEVILTHEKTHAFWDKAIPDNKKKPLLDKLEEIEPSKTILSETDNLSERATETITLYKLNKERLTLQEKEWAEEVLREYPGLKKPATIPPVPKKPGKVYPEPKEAEKPSPEELRKAPVEEKAGVKGKVAPSEKEAKIEGKEPWRMTKAEWSNRLSEKELETLPSDTAKRRALSLETHKSLIRQALSEGKPVPRNVLEEYKTEPWAKKALKKKPSGIQIKAKGEEQRYLVPWIAKSGGIKETELAGEIRDIIYTVDARGKKKLIKGVTPGFINKAGRGLDEVVRDAQEAGFAVKDTDELLELIEKDIGAKEPAERVARLTDAAYESKLWDEYVKEAEDRGISEREAKGALEKEVAAEIAEEAEFARAERETIQAESESFFREDVSFKPEEIESTEKPTPAIKLTRKIDKYEYYKSGNTWYYGEGTETPGEEVEVPSLIQALEAGKYPGSERKIPTQESLITEEAPFELTREEAPPKTLGPQGKKAVFPTEARKVATKGEQKTLLPPEKGEQLTIERKKAEREKAKPEMPLIRTIGEDYFPEFLHGTKAKNLKTLAARQRPVESAKKPSGKTLFDVLIPPEQNEFGAELLLSEKKQPQQALMFSSGRGEALAVVEVKPGTKMLDLSDEATRAPTLGFGDEPKILQFFERPAITDDFIDWKLSKVSENYKKRNPDWKNKITSEMDPFSPDFRVESWRENLVRYAKEKGYGLIRFADETLVTDRSVLKSVRRATEKEIEKAQSTRTYPPSTRASLFTGRPTGAREEAKPTPTKKPTKSVILKDKKQLLADIDKAIEEVPKTEAMKNMVHFDIDGGANILNTKEALGAFRRRVNATAENKPVKIPTLRVSKALPKPKGKKPEFPIEEEKEILREYKTVREFGGDVPLAIRNATESYNKSQNFDQIYKDFEKEYEGWSLKEFRTWLDEIEYPNRNEIGTEKIFKDVVKRYAKILKEVEPTHLKETKKAETREIKEEVEKKAPEGPSPTAKSLADIGGYATLKHRIVEMPEIVDLAQKLLKGRYPSIKRRLRAAHGMAKGAFHPSGLGKIDLKAEIFKNSDEAAAVLSHEIGHLVDWLPEKTLSRGNILGRIANLKKYMKHTLPQAPGLPGELTNKDRQRLRYEAKKLAEAENKDKYIDEVIRKELPILPEDVLKIWNAVEDAKLINKDLYDYVAMLSTPEKKAIVKDALKGQLPADLKQFAKVVEEKTGKKTKVKLYEEIEKDGKKVKIPTKKFKQLIKKKYQDLINRELEKRHLFHLNEVMDEMKVLSREWKPFDPSADPKYTKYRYNPKELYADAFSALLNAPGLVRARAPKFYEGFFNYLERKPEVERLYYDIQDGIKSGEVEKQRTEGIYEMFRKGDDAYALSLQKDAKAMDILARDFIDVNWFILKKIKDIGERNVPAQENPRYKLENMNYSGSETEMYLVKMLREVIKPLEKQNLTWDDLGAQLYWERVAGERAEMANPKGWTPELAKKKLAELSKERTQQEQEAMQAAVKAFRDIHKYVVEKGEKAGRWSKEILDVMKNTEEYATFDVIKYIEKRHGRGPAAKIYQQIGTFNEVSNPATATILKDIAIIRATNKQIAAESVVDFWQKHFPNEIQPADTKWNGKFHEIKDPPPGSKQGLIVYLKDGKPQGFYVNKYIAEAFDSNPMEGQLICRILGKTVQPFRMAFVELNYGFWVFNAFFRDYQRAAKMLPKASMLKFLPSYFKGIKPAFKSVFAVPDPVIEEMQKQNMLISIADVHGLRAEDKQIDRLLKMMHMKPTKWNNKLIKPFGALFNYWTNIGRALERTTKVASYKYLKKKFPDMDPEMRAHIVRVRGGSPDFLRRGSWYPIYNNTLLFSNAMKEGYRGDYEAFADSPGEFIYKQAKYTYIPKILMWAAATGMLGYATKAIFDGASEYDKANYMLIPLGLTESGKSVYFRVPTDETSRFMGGILWKILNHKEIGWGDVATGLFDYMAGQAPTIHPGIDIAIDTVQYASGKNPYDAFYGRYAIPEDIFEAGGERSHKAFLRYLADKAGANIVYRFKGESVDQIKTELEKAVDFPFLSNIVGRFIKVSNYGIREDLRRAKQESRKGNKRALLDAKDALIKFVNEEPLTQDDIAALAAKPNIIERNFIVNLARKHGNVYLDEFMRCTTNEEKGVVLGQLLKRNALMEKVEQERRRKAVNQ